MLPRCDMFKEVLFCPRLVVFNESFVPAGKGYKKFGPTAVLWHEAISGRSKQDLISTFYAFLSSVRDTEHVVLWLDNCSAQNKNWCLFCFFVFMVNTNETALKTLEIKYFQSGHTFMAADSFHHQVEKSLQKMAKVHDFRDFVTAVTDASKNVNIIEMDFGRFYNWPDHSSKYKISRSTIRPYLNKMVYVRAERGKTTLFYREFFDQSDITLNFLKAKVSQKGITKPESKIRARGITVERKKLILTSLTSVMPANRKLFWENLPTSNEEEPLDGE